MDRLYKMVEVI